MADDVNYLFEGDDDPDEWGPDVIDAIRRGASSIGDLEAADRLVDRVSATMIAVATGGPSIDKADPGYKRDSKALRAVLRRLDVTSPNRYDDLWQWYSKWSDGTLPSYASRRTFIADLYRPVRTTLEALADGHSQIARGADDGPSGWPEVDRRLGALQRRVREAADADDYKAVGLQCVSVLEALGRAVYDPSYLPPGEDEPHANAAKARVRYFLQAVADDRRFKDVRRMANGAWDQAQAIKHRNEPNVTDAGIAADAVALLVAMMRRIADEAHPPPTSPV